jgi:DNA-binding transcriptional LysR family regulator
MLHSMTAPDFNLLVALDVLLAEESVTRAATRLRLSPSAMSRTLSRLRDATGDLLLVRAGQQLVPTPRATELRARVSQVVKEGTELLRPAAAFDLKRLERTFTLRTSEGFVENFGPALIARVGKDAPHVRLRFIPKSNKDSTPLRDGSVDLETGVVEMNTSPELRARALFRDVYVGVVRKGHPLSKGRITAARYAAGRHISVSKRGMEADPIDDALAAFGLKREIASSIVGGYSTALAVARESNLVASVPERHTGKLRTGMHTFRLPFQAPELTISLIWHPRMDTDAAHRWLRGAVVDASAG